MVMQLKQQFLDEIRRVGDEVFRRARESGTIHMDPEKIIKASLLPLVPQAALLNVRISHDLGSWSAALTLGNTRYLI